MSLVEVSHQLKKLNHEAKRRDVVAENTNITSLDCNWAPYLLDLGFHSTLSVKYTCTHVCTAACPYVWYHSAPYSPPIQTYIVPTWDSVYSSFSFLPHQCLVIREGLLLRAHSETGPPHVPLPWVCISTGNFTQQRTPLIQFPLSHSLLWCQTVINAVKPGQECVWRSCRMELVVRRGVNYRRLVHLFPAMVAFEIFLLLI